MPDSLGHHGWWPARLFHLWGFPGKNTGKDCLFQFQGIFPTQGSILCLWHWQADSLPLSYLGSPTYRIKYCNPYSNPTYRIKYCNPYSIQIKIQYLFNSTHYQFNSLKISNMAITLKLTSNFIPRLCWCSEHGHRLLMGRSRYYLYPQLIFHT